MTAAAESMRSASRPKRPTRADHLAHAVGQGHPLQRVVCYPPARGVLVDGTGLHQMTQDLAHEEGVAVGLPVHAMSEADRAVIERVTGDRFHHLDHTRVIEPCELDTGDSVLSMQEGQCLEQRMRARQLTIPIRPERQQPQRLLRRDHVTPQLQAGFVRPLQVVEYQDDRPMLGHHPQQPDHRGEEEEALGLGIGGLRRRKLRQPLSQGRDQPGQLRSVHVERSELVFWGMGDVVAERFGEQLVRGGEIFFAMPEQHTGTGVEGSAGCLCNQRGLAETRLARDEKHLAPLASCDAFERIHHRCRLAGATDHASGRTHVQAAW